MEPLRRLATARRLEAFAETKTDFARPLEEVRAGLEAAITEIESAIAEFPSDDEGRMISFDLPAESATETASRGSA